MRSLQFNVLLLLFAFFLYTTDGCSRKKDSKRNHNTVPTPHTSTTTQVLADSLLCKCVPLDQCPDLMGVLKGPKPIQPDTLRALQNATCYPVREKRNPSVRCCPQYVRSVTESSSTFSEVSTSAPELSSAKSTSVLVDSSGESATSNTPLFSECGVCGKEALLQRIVGGKDAGLGQFPWIARLGYTSSKGNADSATYQCAGSLISEYYIITAAHCVVLSSRAPQLRWARLGEHDERTEEDCNIQECAPPTQDIVVQAWKVYPDYDAKTYQHDIALVRLKTPVTFTRWVHSICLPPEELGDVAGRNAVVSGWGTTEPGVAVGSPVLQALWKKIGDISNCTKRYKGISNIKSGQICAGGTKGEDSCGGDSGGPLALPLSSSEISANSSESTDNLRYTLMGIVSFGARFCGAGNLPGVYTNTQHYMPWIREAVNTMDKMSKTTVQARISWSWD